MTQPSLPIRIDRVGKAYGAVKALDDVSLDIGAGEFLTLLGPSGSGKTTLLNIIAGFTRLDSGRIRFGDRDMTLEPPHRRDLGLVFQSYALFPHMDVAANVGFPLLARKAPREDIRRRVESALALVQLQGFEARRISELSGGQKQRVALARAIVFEPKIILMDEPLSALDKQLREHMQIELRHLHRQLGATTVYVTHDQREALTMSDRVAVLDRGRLLQVGRPETIYESPANRFVAEFIGESALLPVTRAGVDSVLLGSATIRCARSLPEAERLLLAVRSEKLLLADEADSGANRLDGVVQEKIYQGDSVLVFAELGPGLRLTMRRPARQASLAALPRPGEPIALALNPHDAVVIADD